MSAKRRTNNADLFEGQPGVFGMSKNAIGGGQLICGSPGLRLPTFELVAAPFRVVGARAAYFLPPQCA